MYIILLHNYITIIYFELKNLVFCGWIISRWNVNYKVCITIIVLVNNSVKKHWTKRLRVKNGFNPHERQGLIIL